ncbi:MAG TPA: hypothetical protein VGL42_03410 [Opitutaceae bacterium]|jgi:Spy/CpxP family protein refolding chaperone
MKPFTKLTFLGGAFAAALPLALAAADLAPAPSPDAPVPVTVPATDAATAAPSAKPDHSLRMMRRHIALHHLARRLGLTPDQLAQIKTIRGNTHTAMVAIRANPALTPDQRHEQIHTLRAASRQQMEALLTADQQAKLAKIRARLIERFGSL